MSDDRIEVGCYGLGLGDDSMPLHVLVIRVNSVERVVVRQRDPDDEHFWGCVKLALSDPAEARVMWEMAKGGPR